MDKSNLKEIKIDMTTSGLRKLLFLELENFRDGKSTVKRAQTIINFSREIIAAARLEMVTAAILLEKARNNESKTLSLK